MGNGNSLETPLIRKPFPTRKEQGESEHPQGRVDEGEGEGEGESESPSLVESRMQVGMDMDGSSTSSTSSSDGVDSDPVDSHLDLLQQLHDEAHDNIETVTCVSFFSLFQRRQKSFLLLNRDDNDDGKGELEPADSDYLLSPSSSTSSSSLCTPKYKYWASRSRLFSSSTSTSSFSECKGDYYHDDENDNNSSSETDDPDHQRTSSPLRRNHTHNPPHRVNSWISFLSDNKSTLQYTEAELALSDSKPTAASDLLSADRPVWIVTTAALPWMTGTAVNPLLRAAYLSQRYRQQRQQRQQQQQHEGSEGVPKMGNDSDDNENSEEKSNICLVIPWLESADDRVALYGPDWQDATQAEQETYIRQWLAQSAGLPLEADPVTGLQIQFYPARYHAGLSSIFAMGDFCERLEVPKYNNNKNLSAVCILEEPEHLNYYRAPGKTGWRRKFPHVVGIIHTNYKAYASHHLSGLVTGPLVGALSAWMVRAYCDKVIKLSPVLQAYAPEKEIVDNVHGIRHEFLNMARPNGNQVYFIGKLLWAKGLDRLLDLQAFYKKKTGSYFAMSVYGSGPEEKAIQRAYLGTDASEEGEGSNSSGNASSSASSYYAWTPRRQVLPVAFLGRLDHAKVPVAYKIFVNPSVTEVLCTTTAEALAMGKFVIIPNHASNTFFQQFPNCLHYQTKAEFGTRMEYALAHDPEPLSDALRYTLTWEAATERLLEAAMISERDAARRDRVGKQWDERIANVHYELGKGHTGDAIRKVLGGGPVADQFKYEQVVSSPTRDNPVLK